MAMYVLLSFEDDKDAVNFADSQLEYSASVQAWKEGKTELPGFLNEGVIPDAVVEGIYKKPTQFCDPTASGHSQRRVHGWGRGKKYGWQVCADCGKPARMASENMCSEFSGWNLLARLFELVVPKDYWLCLTCSKRHHDKATFCNYCQTKRPVVPEEEEFVTDGVIVSTYKKQECLGDYPSCIMHNCPIHNG